MNNIDWTVVQAWMVSFGVQLLIAAAILLVGYWLAGFVSRLARRAMARAEINEAVSHFLGNLAYYLVLIFAVLAALSQVGVQTASIIAVLGAASLAVGLALQGALANFAAGVLILVLRPYDLGDLVEIAGTLGTVETIQIFNTILVTPDNKTVIIPNGQVTSGIIVNYTRKGTLRLDMVFGIGYADDLLRAKQVLAEIITADERVLADPPPTVAVLELADSSVNFAVRPFVKAADYWDVYFDTHEQVKLRFDQEGISIPFPQQDVHLFQESA
jgi:small conductance mechanosensitive channel